MPQKHLKNVEKRNFNLLTQKKASLLPFLPFPFTLPFPSSFPHASVDPQQRPFCSSARGVRTEGGDMHSLLTATLLLTPDRGAGKQQHCKDQREDTY